MMYTICLNGRNVGALLFDSLEVEQIASDPALHALFPQGYYVQTEGGRPAVATNSWSKGRDATPDFRTVVTTLLTTPEPDQAALDSAPVRFYRDGVKHEINLRQRYNQCLSLFKAVGCRHCPERGAACLSQAAHIALPSAVERLDPDDLLERLSKEKTIIAGHKYITPTATRTKEFSSTFREPREHDFEKIEDNQESLSDRATKAAATRKFKKSQCVKCPINDSCDAARHCKGAFPPKEDIIEMSNRALDEALKSSTLPAWQVWELARGMGETAKHSRWNIMLTGVVIQGNQGFHASVHRAKSNIVAYGGLKTYEDIARVFKLPLTEAECVGVTHGPVTDPELRATWWMALNTHNAHQNYGWGCRMSLIGVGINNNHVPIQWSRGSYLSYGGELHKISDVARHLSYGRLAGIDKVEIR